ncbi:hypothetical protein GCM10020367_54880 [Streptomyces sannanensis]|uniref:Uncharacterized protein n=1 Tax=Streptomyces sannanensis TaxID=285536 RepID=A0ABP6SIJ4_9ACTN
MSDFVSAGGGHLELDEERGGELAARWWQWALSAPWERSPVRDETGEFADWQQPDDVWFLAGTYGGRVVRRCSIPTGRPVFFPVVNTQRPQSLLQREPMVLEVAGAKVFLNALPLPIREFTSPPFRAEEKRRVAWGLWCAFEPLPAGQYVVEIKAMTSGGFRVDTTYHLTVTDD